MRSKSASNKPLRGDLQEVVDRLAEHQIKLEALEQVLVKTNPLVHELYLGQLEVLSKERNVISNPLPSAKKRAPRD